MTGLTDQNRADFRLMKELGQVLHKGPVDRIDDVRNLIDDMNNMKKVREKMEEWKIEIIKEPLKLTAQVCKADRIEMARGGRDFATTCAPNEFDRNI